MPPGWSSVRERDGLSAGYVPLAAVERNGFDEGIHFGRLIALDADGSRRFAFGDVDAPMHPRSANKLMQAAGMRSLGLALEGEQLALSAASHWGSPSTWMPYARCWRPPASTSRRCRPRPRCLRTPTRAALSCAVTVWRVRSITAARASTRRCSRRACGSGWDVSTYLDVEHPLQAALREYVEGVVGAPTAHTAVDGCGAPAWAMSLRDLAPAYRAGVLAEPGTPLRDVADAMRAHPEYVCGEQSEVTGLMRAVPGLLLKDGAESVYAAALPDGRAVAVKVSDGGFRAGQAVLVAALDSSVRRPSQAPTWRRWSGGGRFPCSATATRWAGSVRWCPDRARVVRRAERCSPFRPYRPGNRTFRPVILNCRSSVTRLHPKGSVERESARRG